MARKLHNTNIKRVLTLTLIQVTTVKFAAQANILKQVVKGNPKTQKQSAKYAKLIDDSVSGYCWGNKKT